MSLRISPYWIAPVGSTRPAGNALLARFDRGEAIATAVANRKALTCSLFDLPRVQATDEELHVVRTAHAEALALGLTLPKFPLTTMRFVEDRRRCRGGETQQSIFGGPIEMAFSSGLSLSVGMERYGLRHVALHELAHVDQFATGRIASLSVDAREQEAEEFAWDVLERGAGA